MYWLVTSATVAATREPSFHGAAVPVVGVLVVRDDPSVRAPAVVRLKTGVVKVEPPFVVDGVRSRRAAAKLLVLNCQFFTALLVIILTRQAESALGAAMP